MLTNNHIVSSYHAKITIFSLTSKKKSTIEKNTELCNTPNEELDYRRHDRQGYDNVDGIIIVIL